ncbi:AzlD domain-containing protein [uncultured Tateyamaria sp.]|uniref:AzlD domain-containing protein n=1 Tax=Tateyamaria sp. 1078 TaxID=3417464 RepID=UPI002616CCBA|nr:AzlD domain-containing protein [uncultured Tateyamaria sp.]
MIDQGTLWTVIIGLGVGSFLLRFAFLGFVGDRPLPDWMLRHLRYTAVSILPALCAPLVVYSGQDEATEPSRLAAAVVTLVAGALSRNVFVAIGCGAATLFAAVYLLG